MRNVFVSYSHRLDQDVVDEFRRKFGNDKITRASIMNSSTGIAKKARAQMKNEDDKESRTVE